MMHPTPHDGLEYFLTHIIQDFMRFLHQTGLSRPQVHALLHIYHSGECPISEIGALTNSSAAAASQLAERLVQQGLVERSEDPQNRRVKKLRLTENGLELINQGMTSNHFLAELMGVLTLEQREIVHTAFGYLAQAGRQIESSPNRKAEQHA